MHAIISTGGRQELVAEGDEVFLDLAPHAEGTRLRLAPLALLDGEGLAVGAEALGEAVVEAEVLGVVKGPKIRGFTYKAKANERRRFGHRQRYLRVRITSITQRTTSSEG